MLVIVNPYHRSVTIDGVEVVQKIIEFPNELNHLSTISCTYDAEQQQITKVHDLHRFTSNFIEREYFFDHLPVFIEWYYKEQQAQIEDEAKKEQYKQDIQNAYDSTVRAGKEAVININTDKDNALEAIDSSKTNVLNTFTAKRAEALNAIQDSKIASINEITNTTNDSIGNITNTTNSGLASIQSKENEALNKISNDRAEALSAILSDRQSSLDAINSSINKATTQADRSKTEADRSQKYAEQMAAVANVKPATKDSIGLVVIGDNVDVNEEGTISVPKSAKATQDEEGNDIPEVAGVVTTGNTITNTDGKLDVNLGDSLETDEDGKINPKLSNAFIKKNDGTVDINLGNTFSKSADGVIDIKLGSTLVKSGDNIGVNTGASLEADEDGKINVKESALSNVVHTSGNEQIYGIKQFNNGIQSKQALILPTNEDRNGGVIELQNSNSTYGTVKLDNYSGQFRVLCYAATDPNSDQKEGADIAFPRKRGIVALTSDIPSASNSNPVVSNATPTAGTSASYARADHAHPLPTEANTFLLRKVNNAKEGGEIHFEGPSDAYGGFYIDSYDGIARIVFRASPDGTQKACALSIPRRTGLLNSVEIGVIVFFAKASAPYSYLVCNGGAISRTTYADLFSVIGTTFGAGNGSTTFNLPNLIDKVAWGNTTVGTVKSAGLPNISGGLDFGDRAPLNGWTPTGAFAYTGNKGFTFSSNDVRTDNVSRGVTFNAASSNAIYGKSTTVQPPALTLLPCIRYE